MSDKPGCIMENINQRRFDRLSVYKSKKENTKGDSFTSCNCTSIY